MATKKKPKQEWARTMIKGVQIYLKRCDTPEEARKLREFEQKRKHYSEVEVEFCIFFTGGKKLTKE